MTITVAMVGRLCRRSHPRSCAFRAEAALARPFRAMLSVRVTRCYNAPSGGRCGCVVSTKPDHTGPSHTTFVCAAMCPVLSCLAFCLVMSEETSRANRPNPSHSNLLPGWSWRWQHQDKQPCGLDAQYQVVRCTVVRFGQVTVSYAPWLGLGVGELVAAGGGGGGGGAVLLEKDWEATRCR